MKKFAIFAIFLIPAYAYFWHYTLLLFTHEQKQDIYNHLLGSSGILQKIVYLFKFIKHIDALVKVVHYIVIYIILQVFAIPGSSAMSLLGGLLFGRLYGMLLVAISTAIGSTGCYLLSSKLTPTTKIPSVVEKWRLKMKSAIDSQSTIKASLLMILIRMTPFTPNWVINLLAPHLNIPIIPYFFGTLIGIVPLHFCYVQFGTRLSEMVNLESVSISDAVDSTTLWSLAAMAIVGWVPFLF